VEPRCTSLKNTSAYVSIPSKISFILEKSFYYAEMVMVVVKEVWQLEIHSSDLMLSLKKGSGIWLCFSRLRCNVEGTVTSYYLLRMSEASVGPSVTFIFHDLSSLLKKSLEEQTHRRSIKIEYIFIVLLISIQI
jgi:hypothetical protein